MATKSVAGEERDALETCEVRDEVEKEEDEKVDGEHGEHGEHAAQASQGFELELRKEEAIPAVQICVRLRPMLQWERAEGYEPSGMEFKEGVDGNISLKEDGRQRHFGFNSVMGQESTQQEVWDTARMDSVVSKVALGFNATVFAYGQTGTGKTHTMEGFTYEHHCGSYAPTMQAARPRAKACSRKQNWEVILLALLSTAKQCWQVRLGTKCSEAPFERI